MATIQNQMDRKRTPKLHLFCDWNLQTSNNYPYLPYVVFDSGIEHLK